MKPLRKIKNQLAATFPRAAAAYRGTLRDLNERRPPQVTPFGFKFIGNAVMETGQFEKEESELILDCMAAADVVINVGANVGYYCCLALQSGKELLAFEPDYRNLKTLYKNLRLNNWTSGFEIYPLAISNNTGLVQLFGENTWASLIEGWGGATPKLSSCTPCTTLDRILGTRLSGRKAFFLIDIEGAEFLLLQGAHNQLNLTPRATWLVEISSCENQPMAVGMNPNLVPTFEMFWAAGYEAFAVGSGLTPVSQRNVLGVASMSLEPFKTHNFLFLPPKVNTAQEEGLLAVPSATAVL